jgi:hypothetical protein
MSQIILDDQLFDVEVLVPLARWITVQRLRELRPNEVIKDDRVPLLLRELRQPSFVTIDMGFWNKDLRDPKYCILCFPLRNEEQHLLPERLYRLFQLAEFHTKAARMGRVVRVGPERIDYWVAGDEQVHRLAWTGAS